MRSPLRFQALDAMQLALARAHVARAVHDDARALQCDQPAADHLVQCGKHALNRLLGLHHFDDDGEIERQAQHLVGVQGARRAESGDAAQHRRAREALPAQPLEQRLVQRPPVVLVALPDENAHQGALAFESVGHSVPSVGMLSAIGYQLSANPIADS